QHAGLFGAAEKDAFRLAAAPQGNLGDGSRNLLARARHAASDGVEQQQLRLTHERRRKRRVIRLQHDTRERSDRTCAAVLRVSHVQRLGLCRASRYSYRREPYLKDARPVILLSNEDVEPLLTMPE